MQEDHPGPEERPARGRRSGGHWLALAVAALGIAALLALRFGVEPDARGHGTHEQLGLPACASMELFGVPCPGCGVTTSSAWAVRGELGHAFLVQPFGMVVVLGIPLFALWAVWELARGRDLGRDLTALPKRPWIVLGSALLVAAWIYKLVITFAG